jgi:hypothetical protein
MLGALVGITTSAAIAELPDVLASCAKTSVVGSVATKSVPLSSAALPEFKMPFRIFIVAAP